MRCQQNLNSSCLSRKTAAKILLNALVCQATQISALPASANNHPRQQQRRSIQTPSQYVTIQLSESPIPASSLVALSEWDDAQPQSGVSQDLV